MNGRLFSVSLAVGALVIGSISFSVGRDMGRRDDVPHEQIVRMLRDEGYLECSSEKREIVERACRRYDDADDLCLYLLGAER